MATRRWRNPGHRRHIAPTGLAQRFGEGHRRQHDVIHGPQPHRCKLRRHLIDNAKAGIALCRDHPFDHLFGRTVGRLQLQQRIRGAQATQEVADPLEFDIIHQGEIEAAGHLPLDRPGVAQQQIEVRQNTLGIDQQRFANLGQLDAVAGALEERDT